MARGASNNDGITGIAVFCIIEQVCIVLKPGSIGDVDIAKARTWRQGLRTDWRRLSCDCAARASCPLPLMREAWRSMPGRRGRRSPESQLCEDFVRRVRRKAYPYRNDPRRFPGSGFLAVTLRSVIPCAS